MSEFRTCVLWYYGTVIACTSVRQLNMVLRYFFSSVHADQRTKFGNFLRNFLRNFIEIYGNVPPTLESEKFLMYSLVTFGSNG